MAGTDYSFDGLDDMEKKLKKMMETYPRELEQYVINLASDLQGAVKEKTPVSKNRKSGGGHLRREWKVGKIKKIGNEYVIEVYNNVEYAAHVEFGHRTRGGKGFVKGSHMMELSVAKLNERLPKHLQSWLRDFLSTHEL